MLAHDCTCALTVTGLVGLLMANAHAQGAPATIRGKSVTVNWSEQRQQRPEGDDEVRSVTRMGEMRLYFSQQGRAFNRVTMSIPAQGGAFTAAQGSSDQVQGRRDQFSSRVVQFQGNSISVDTPLQPGVRRVGVTLDALGRGCSAQVFTGKSGGNGPIVVKSLVTGKRADILSVTTGSAECRVVDGNVFGAAD